MKFLIALMFLSSLAVAAPTGKAKILPVTKEEEQVKKDKIARDQAAKEKLKMLDKKEEDCDDKAKKTVEVKPETISLGGGLGTAGCTLPE